MPSEEERLSDYLKLGASAAGHFVLDMVPYYLTGNSNTREQFETKILMF